MTTLHLFSDRLTLVRSNVWVKEFNNAEQLFLAIWKDNEDTNTGKRHIMQMGVTAFGTDTNHVAKDWVLAVAKLYANKEMTNPQIEENTKRWLSMLDNGGKVASEPWQSLRSVATKKPAGQPAAGGK